MECDIYINDISTVTSLMTQHHTKIDKYLSTRESAKGDFSKSCTLFKDL